MKKLRILVDMDDTSVDLMTEWLRIYNLEWNDNVKHADIKGWSVHNYIKPECGVKVYDILKRPGLFDHLQPYPGAVEAITAWVQQGHDVRFVTATPSPDSARGKVEWTLRTFAHLNFKMEHVVQLHDKSLLAGDVLIDDKAETVRNWVATGRPCFTIEHAHNQEVRDIASIYAPSYKDPARAWKAFVKGVDALSLGKFK